MNGVQSSQMTPGDTSVASQLTFSDPENQNQRSKSKQDIHLPQANSDEQNLLNQVKCETIDDGINAEQLKFTEKRLFMEFQSIKQSQKANNYCILFFFLRL